jgi:hypothetical protein
MSARPDRFDERAISCLDEPVRRYLMHALPTGGQLHERVEITMQGRIRVGVWLSFTAQEQFWDHSFCWNARVGLGPAKPLRVVDRYAESHGRTEGRLFGRLRFLRAEDEHATRSAAGRAAVESFWVPARLLPARGARWRAEADDHIVTSISAPPEDPDVHLWIDASGALRRFCVQRWGTDDQADYGYIPFGGRVVAEQRFDDVVIPSQLEAGWWFGTDRYRPSITARITAVVPI